MMGINSVPRSELSDSIWVDLLPWLDLYVSSRAALLEPLAPGEDWWLSDPPTFTATEVDLEKVLLGLAELYVAHHKHLPFAEAFPTLTGDLPVAVLGLEARAITVLRRMTSDTTLGSILTHTAQDMFAIKGTAERTVTEVALGLVMCSVAKDPRSMLDPDDAQSDEPPVITQLVDDLAQLAVWQRVRGRDTAPLLSVEIDAESPEAIQEVAARIGAVTASDLPDPGSGDAIDEIENLVAQLDTRETTALRERLLAQNPISIGELSTKLHLSKSATSVIEARVKEKINEACGYGTAVGLLTASLRVEIQPVASLQRLLMVHPLLSAEVPTLGVPLWLVLDRLDDSFEVADGWAVSPDVSTAKTRTQSLLEDLESQNGVVSLDEVAQVASMSREDIEAWFSWCGLTVVAGSVLTRVRKMADLLIGTLEAIGKPLSAADLGNAAQSGRPDTAIRRALEKDDRAILGDDGLYRMTTWSAAPGGQLEVSPTTNDINGENSRPRRGPKSPDVTRRLYRVGFEWRYRMVASADHLRGSGFALPAGVAATVRCDRGDVVELDSRLGTQMIRWTGAQPTSGTIRRFLAELSIAAGGTVLLCFGPDRTFDVLELAEVDQEADPLRRALALVGTTDPMAISERHVIRVLSDAIGLHGETRPRRLLSAYEDHGDDAVVALLEKAWVTKMDYQSE
ncbi:hypothetical protein [Rhodococcus sp. SORGH_AS_0303]|uniref:hypothetical protein n=1 Tax=Rhodococcus sp. SORGH_AS_0303 TaxID=3041753 RepID=UPI0027868B36|nr:hypothetical protein [Rhodococcus sp. SORGH_AS_0303]MDQ1200482.1 hypothetical protein [Rhodococcus sp. SORGH_AS_0303]